MDYVLGVNAYMTFSPHLAHEGESWIASVSQSLALIKKTSSNIEDKVEVDPDFSQLMVHLPHYAQRLATMRICYEYLATMSVIVRRHRNFLCLPMVASSIGPTTH